MPFTRNREDRKIFVEVNTANKLGKKRALFNTETKQFTTSTSTKEEVKLITETLKHTTLSDKQKAEEAVNLLMGVKRAEDATFYAQPTNALVLALEDLLAPSFYDISDFSQQNKKPIGKTLGHEQKGNKKVYRFQLTDVLRHKFSYTGMKLDGVCKTGNETDIETTVQKDKLIITINNVEKINPFLQTIKNITPFLPLPDDQGVINDEWLQTLSNLKDIEVDILPDNHPNKEKHQFTITNECLQKMPKDRLANLVHKLTTSAPARQHTKQKFKAFVVHAQRAELQPKSRILSSLKLIPAILAAAMESVKVLFTKQSTTDKEKSKQILAKPFKLIADILNFKNTPTVLNALEKKSSKLIYLACKPVSAIPVLGEMFDKALIKKLCKKEMEKQKDITTTHKSSEKQEIKKTQTAIHRTKHTAIPDQIKTNLGKTMRQVTDKTKDKHQTLDIKRNTKHTSNKSII